MTTLSYLHLRPGQPPPPLGDGRPFGAVLVIEDAVNHEWRALVSDWLVASGCLYMVAWGRGCRSWDDSVDYANLSHFDDGETPVDAFVMRTWHTEESLTETFWFAGQWASHRTVDLWRTIIIHVSPEQREADLLEAFQMAQGEGR